MQSFLGFCNYYRNFIRNFSEIVKPLFKMTSKKEKFEWTEEGLAMFHKLKEMLTSQPVLAYPDHEKQFFVECDACNYEIGGVLSQKEDDGTLHPIYNYSKTLSKAEVKYSITEKELLAIKTAFTERGHLLQGAKKRLLYIVITEICYSLLIPNY